MIVQSPNFFGIVEQVREVAELVHRHGALLVVVVSEAASLGLLAPPKEADIVAGELQSFAHPPSYGGPYVGILATKTRHIRQMPGRLVGETLDAQGRRAYCLTLATREQHIRRARATSNICTNQALVALMATVYMTLLGRQGLRELAEQNLAKAHFLSDALQSRRCRIAFLGPVLQRVRRASSRKVRERGQPTRSRVEDRRRSRLGPFLSGTRGSLAGLRYGDGIASGDGSLHELLSGRQPMSRVRPHPTLDEPLIFERSSPGKIGYQLPGLDVPAIDPRKVLGSENLRADIEGFPEVSEVEVIRHFTRLSTWNYAIDLGLYPLGSCTMKYNPRLNEAVARIEGIIDAHPYQPESLAQGMLHIQRTLEQYLVEITGMDAVTLQPAAGAHGELTGLLLVRAYLESLGDARRVVLIPDSAHGTNPATAAIAGYDVLEIASNARGMIDVGALEAAVDGSVAALMVTNPNTLGIFEQDIAPVAEILHRRGAQLYMDGANMNALVGVARPGEFGVDVMHLNLQQDVLHAARGRRAPAPDRSPSGLTSSRSCPFLASVKDQWGCVTTGTARSRSAKSGHSTGISVCW